jgi:hypothetical protein
MYVVLAASSPEWVSHGSGSRVNNSTRPLAGINLRENAIEWG